MDILPDIVEQWGRGGLAWLIGGGLMLVGLVGCVIPALPGHLLIFFGALAYRLILGPEAGIAWWGFVILAILLVVSQLLEFMSGAAGTRWFGGSRWGAAGALIGGLVGMFFFPLGLLLGPLLGSLLFEKIFAKKENKPAVVSSVGSVVGTLAGMVIKVAVGIVMIVWVICDVFWLGARG